MPSRGQAARTQLNWHGTVEGYVAGTERLAGRRGWGGNAAQRCAQHSGEGEYCKQTGEDDCRNHEWQHTRPEGGDKQPRISGRAGQIAEEQRAGIAGRARVLRVGMRCCADERAVHNAQKRLEQE